MEVGKTTIDQSTTSGILNESMVSALAAGVLSAEYLTAIEGVMKLQESFKPAAQYLFETNQIKDSILSGVLSRNKSALLAARSVGSAIIESVETLTQMQKSMEPILQTFHMAEQMRQDLSNLIQISNPRISPNVLKSIKNAQNLEKSAKVLAEYYCKRDHDELSDAFSTLAGIDIKKLSVVAEKTGILNDYPNGESAIEEFIDKITDINKIETDKEKKTIKAIQSVKNTKELTNEEKSLRLSYISTIFTILSCFLSLYFGIASLENKVEIPETTNNNVQYVNNYYIYENGYDKGFLNSCGLRIVNQRIKPRTRPDCSSAVTGTLDSGTVVSINKKYKKWIRITWLNEEGEYISGWIQNYKVSEFTK